ncbi:MAG: hypothetical protein WCP11_02795 [Candidatus Saccharibacteria bacterium]
MPEVLETFASLMEQGECLIITAPKKALDIFEQASQKASGKNENVSVMRMIGITYNQLKKPKEAKEYLLGAEALLPPGCSETRALLERDLGRVYLESNCQKQAYICFLNSYNMFDALDYKHNAAISYGYTGYIKYQMREIEGKQRYHYKNPQAIAQM